MMAWWFATAVSWAVTGAGHTGVTGGTGAHSAAGTYPHTGWTQETGTTPKHSGGSGHSGTHSQPTTTYPTDATDDGTTTDTGDEKQGPCSCGTAGPDPILGLPLAAIVLSRRRGSRQK